MALRFLILELKLSENINEATLKMFMDYYPSITERTDVGVVLKIPADKIVNDWYIDPVTNIELGIGGIKIEELRKESDIIANLSNNQNYSNN